MDEATRGAEIRDARALEGYARRKVESIERELDEARENLKIRTAERLRRELWSRAEVLRAELLAVETRAANITARNPEGR
jgi:aminoglycoside phosphotransferase (APT) family kinase protein